MTELVLSSNNKKKLAELETLLASLSSNRENNTVRVLSLRDIGFSGDIVENGSTYAENSLIKASVPAKMGYIGIADDSGLSVDCLNGAPGVYSARYSGEGATDESNRKKLLEVMADVPKEQRGAKFVCCMSLILPADSALVIPEKWRISAELSAKSGIPHERAMIVIGECRGEILTKESGEGGFGYDSLFYYPEFGATFAEIPQEKKNKVSHRGLAMAEFTSRLMKIIEK